MFWKIGSYVLFVLLGVGALVYAGWSTHNEASTTPQALPDRLKVVNVACPIKGVAFDPATVPPERMRTFQGQVVGFGCDDCQGKWDKMTDEQRAEKLANSMPKTENPGGGT